MYIVCKNFYGKTISGTLLLPVNTELEKRDNLLLYKDKPVCYNTSQNCYDYMANNEDGKGKERYELINNIKKLYSDIIRKDNENYAKLIEGLDTEADTLPEYVSTLPFTIQFNYDFYNSDINKLKEMEAQLNG